MFKPSESIIAVATQQATDSAGFMAMVDVELLDRADGHAAFRIGCFADGASAALRVEHGVVVCDGHSIKDAQAIRAPAIVGMGKVPLPILPVLVPVHGIAAPLLTVDAVSALIASARCAALRCGELIERFGSAAIRACSGFHSALHQANVALVI
jgi:hypothetical protein